MRNYVVNYSRGDMVPARWECEIMVNYNENRRCECMLLINYKHMYIKMPCK